MERQPVEYGGWNLIVYPGHLWVGCARLDRAPFDVHLVKEYSDASVLAALERKVDEIEDAGTMPESNG